MPLWVRMAMFRRVEDAMTGERTVIRGPWPAVGTALVAFVAFVALCSPAAGQAPKGLNAAGFSAERRARLDGASVLRVNTSSDGGQANGSTEVAAVSADGCFIAYSSVATNLVPGDPGGIRDVFVTEVATGETVLASTSLAGHPGSGASGTSLALSVEGRFVAFDSWADDLVVGDTNGWLDIFVRDLQTGATERINTNGLGHEANGPSFGASMSRGGRFVAFSSWASNLVENDVNGVEDVFLHDRHSGVTQRVSQTAGGVGGEAISHSPYVSPNGRYVAYSTRANNLVAGQLLDYYYIFVFDRVTSETVHASVNDLGEPSHGDCNTRPAVSADGRYVTFASPAYNLVAADWNGVSDIFVRDLVDGITSRVSVSSQGVEGLDGSSLPTLSEDGSLVAFVSSAENLVPGDDNGQADVFVHDRGDGSVRRISRAAFGLGASGPSHTPLMTPDGSTVVFGSSAGNLVPGDTNRLPDIFLHRAK